ncbi:MAG: GFA family protein [Amphritea sp.]|nr:GFA family protein [Amphritea sp.]
MLHKGQCHCGAVKFEFEGDEIRSGLRCNCSICIRKAALMTEYAVAPDAITISAEADALATYTFGSGVAQHHFCNRCGIYTFHQTVRQPGHYRINIGCLDGVDSIQMPYKVFDGASLL